MTTNEFGTETAIRVSGETRDRVYGRSRKHKRVRAEPPGASGGPPSELGGIAPGIVAGVKRELDSSTTRRWLERTKKLIEAGQDRDELGEV
jgi:hypothetical protein